MEESGHMAVSKQPMLLEVVRQRIRLKHYSHRTEKSYVHWIRRFVRFNNRRHPRELGKADIEAFLTHLARPQGLGFDSEPSFQRIAVPLSRGSGVGDAATGHRAAGEETEAFAGGAFARGGSVDTFSTGWEILDCG